MDYYLRFETEAQADAALGKTVVKGPVDTEYTTYTTVAGMDLDIIGTIYEPTGEMQTVQFADGLEAQVPVTAPLPGWHVNLRGESLPDGLEQHIINPTNPRRVWA